MSRAVFEYYFEPEDLGPHFAEFAKYSSGEPARASESNHLSEWREGDIVSFATAEESYRNALAGDSPFVREPSKRSCEFGFQPLSDCTLNSAAEIAEFEAEGSTANGSIRRNVRDEFEYEDAAADRNRSRVRQFISVHALGQFVFCRRAGILAAESDDEIDPDEPMPRLTFLPNFDRERIEEMLSQYLSKGLMGVLYISSMVMFLIVGAIKQNQILVSSLLILLSVVLVWEFCNVVTVVRLIARRRKAIHAEAKSPDPDVNELQPVNWWSMLNAGFGSVRYQHPFRHPELPLEGCPWRVLERGSLRIPVIRAGGERLGTRNGELFPKLKTKIVAYAVLLEATNHVKVPFGLIFPRDNPKGLAVPITSGARTGVVTTLKEFMTTINASQQSQMHPALPDNRNQCEGCAFGKPEPINEKEVDSRRKCGSQLVVLNDNKGDTFECRCSTRFGTVPPHKEIKRRRLVAAIQ